MKTSKIIIYVIIFCIILSIIVGFSAEIKETYFQKEFINKINNIDKNFNQENFNQENFNQEELNQENFNQEELNQENFNQEENVQPSEYSNNIVENYTEENNNNNLPEPSFLSSSLEGAPI